MIRLKEIWLFSLTIALVGIATCEYTGRFRDYLNHTCIRDCTASSKPMICEYDWTLETFVTYSIECYDCRRNISDCYRENCIVGDGTQRAIEVVNRLLPGPTIQVCEGDTIVVNLANKVRSEKVTSIHWHGIRQRDTQNMDGIGMITQYPIYPHTEYVYKFQAIDPGTHLWHSHSGVQRADGVFGSLIVRQSKERDVHGHLYDYDLKEHVIVLNDWTRRIFDSSYTPYLHAESYEDIDSILINGRGQASTNLDLNVPLSTFSVKSNQRYRFRVIDAGVNFCPMIFSIDGHNMTVIASDGYPIEPIEVESFVISPGERFDFVLHTHRDDNEGQTNEFWIKVRGEGYCVKRKVFQRAILKYIDNDNDNNNKDDYMSKQESSSKLGALVPMTYENTLRSGSILRETPSREDERPYISLGTARSANRGSMAEYYNQIVSRKPDKKFYLAIDIERVNNPEFNNAVLFPNTMNSFWTPQINNISFMMPSTPLLYNWSKIPKSKICNHETRLNSCPNPNVKFCSCIHTLQVDLNDLVEIVFVDEATGFEYHPMHLHGHSFAYMGSEQLKRNDQMRKTEKNLFMSQVKELDKKGLLKRNMDRPIIKDTLNVPSAGYSIIRFIADNPGTWLLHCHLDVHSDPGLMLVIRVGKDQDLPAN